MISASLRASSSKAGLASLSTMRQSAIPSSSAPRSVIRSVRPGPAPTRYAMPFLAPAFISALLLFELTKNLPAARVEQLAGKSGAQLDRLGHRAARLPLDDIAALDIRQERMKLHRTVATFRKSAHGGVTATLHRGKDLPFRRCES